MEELTALLQESLNGSLYQMIISGVRKSADAPGAAARKKVRPVMMKGQLLFQVSSYVGKRIFHENMSGEEAARILSADFIKNYRQMQIETKDFSADVLASKKGKLTIRRKRHDGGADRLPELSHNRAKNYILQEGKPVPFLIDLGVQTSEGRIVRSRYDKFRQINRFLEFIADIVPKLPQEGTVHIIDFGCGKSYLTFAMYYYLHELKGLSLEVTGLDLKEDVITECARLAQKYGYGGLHFLHGDIADYAGTDSVDMVVTLHACDTATDYALYRAIRWNAKVILSVPCCQHEVNGQISCDALEGALRYGLIKERLSALFTDALRADILEENGYDTQVLEFIDMEHTPKNILLRAVKTSKEGRRKEYSRQLAETLHVHTTLQELLKQDVHEGPAGTK